MESFITPTLTPSVVYDDAHRGIAWLKEVLGFTVASTYPAPSGGIAFAELVWRTGVVFVSDRPPADNPWSKVGTASIALVAASPADVDAIYRRALAAGARIDRSVHDARTSAFPEGSHQFDVEIRRATSGRSARSSHASASCPARERDRFCAPRHRAIRQPTAHSARSRTPETRGILLSRCRKRHRGIN
jgi:uncharacterized glyoxalase superfamily protein PhnB